MSEATDYEGKAREMGWVPQEKWTGDPDKWTDAETFVKRGEEILPILRANNRLLQDDLLTMRNQNDTLAQQLEATRKIVQGLEGKFNESLQRQLKEQRAALRASLREAVEDRDVDRELELREQLDELSEAEKKSKKEVKEDPPTPTQQFDSEFERWKKENPWFDGNSAEDRKKTKAVVRAAEDLRDDGDTSQGYEFYNKALARAEEELGERPVGKVDSGNSRSGAQPSAKGFGSLPKEAQEACMADAEEFVGEGKLFETIDDWKKYYTDTYYGS